MTGATQEIVSVIGLGYVGLPLACLLAEKFEVFGYDTDPARMAELGDGIDRNGECGSPRLPRLRLAKDPLELRAAGFHIVTIPAPADALSTLATILKRGDTVVYESTLAPGTTETSLVPALEKATGLVAGRDFGFGYSPERINPGDRARGLKDIVKVIAAPDIRTLTRMRSVYGACITAGVFTAPSVRAAELAKLVENTQRDLNIALMNDVARICGDLGIQTADVLATARTKWNFLPFEPGLVGGPCVGAASRLLNAAAIDSPSKLVATARETNEGMTAHIAAKTMALLDGGAAPRVGILGASFKENTRDFRSSPALDLYHELRARGASVVISDPLVDGARLRDRTGIELTPLAKLGPVDALVLAVAHEEYRSLEIAKIREMLAPNGVLVDVKRLYAGASLGPDRRSWSL